MTQLNSSEQKTLYDLLVEHLDLSQLERILNHNNLPRLEELAGNGDLRYSMTRVVSYLSREYKIVELVDGVLNEFDNSCPPLQGWLEENRTDLLRRRDNPSIRDRVASFGSHVRAGWLAAGLVIAIAAIAIVANLPNGKNNRRICQLFDTQTQQRILRPFSLRSGAVTFESVDAQCILPAGVIGDVEFVLCDGYLRRKPDNLEDTVDSGEKIRKYFVTRDEDHFYEAIEPELRLLRLPSDREINERIEKNHVAAKDVTLLVKNETDVAIDILLYYLPPSSHEDSKNPLLPRLTPLPPILPRDWSQPFNYFQVEAGFFVVLVSDSSRQAQIVIWDAMYQNHFAVLELTAAGDHPSGKLRFMEFDPRK
ncbi:MAG: hypothetical protein WKF77_11310 [Planctomycetaceae bacterium]